MAESSTPTKPGQDHGRKYGGKPSHVIPLWNGILEHREKIGPALWEFVWCLDKITREDEHGIGWCLGGAPIDAKRIARDLKEHPNTTYENLIRLANDAYIIRKRTPRGYAIGVVNSRKFNAFRHKSDSQKTVNQSKSDSHKRVNQSEGDSQFSGSVIHPFGESDSQKTVSRRDSTVTLQEDSAERERLSAEEARASDSAEPDQTQRLSSAKPKPGARVTPKPQSQKKPASKEKSRSYDHQRSRRFWNAAGGQGGAKYLKEVFGVSSPCHLSDEQFQIAMRHFQSSQRVH